MPMRGGSGRAMGPRSSGRPKAAPTNLPPKKKTSKPVGNSKPATETPLLRTITTQRQPGLEGEVEKASRRASRARNQQPARRQPGPAVPRGRGLTRAQLREKDRIVSAYVERQTAGMTSQQKTDYAADVERAHPSTTRRDLHYLRIRREGGQADAAARQIGAKGTREQKRAAGRSFIASAPTAEAKPGKRPSGISGTLETSGIADLPILRTAIDNMGRGAAPALIGLVKGETAATDIPSKALADAIGLPYNAVKSAYELGAAANAARSGNLEPVKELGEGAISGFAGSLLQGKFGEAGEAFMEHPLYSALEVSGVGSLIGRTAGAGARAGLAGSAGKRAGSTARAPLRIVGDVDNPNLEIARRYDPDLIRKGFQVLGEKRARSRGRDPNVATPAQYDKWIKKTGDQFVSQAEDLRRLGREEATKEAWKTVPTRTGDAEGNYFQRVRASIDQRRSLRAKDRAISRPEQDAMMAMVEGRVAPHTAVEDLLRERNRLQRVYEDEFADLTPAARQANRKNVQALDRYREEVQAGRLDPEELMGHARRYKQLADEATRELIQRGVLDPEQAQHATVRPYAVSRMGARYVETSKRAGEQTTDTALPKQNLRNAKKEERDAEREMLDARDELANASGRSAVLTRNVTGRKEAERAVEKDAREFKRYVQMSGRKGSPKDVSKHIDKVSELLDRTYAGGGLGVKQARERLLAAVERYEKAREGTAARKDVHEKAKKAAKEERRVRQIGPHLVDENGEYLSPEAILKHMDESGVEYPSFVTHRPDLTSSSAFFQNFFGSGRKGVGTFKRTGEATRTGTHATSPEAMVEHLVRQRGIVDAVKAWDDHVGEFGIQKPGGGLFTWDEAVRFNEERMNLRGGSTELPELVPVRAVPAKYGPDRIEAIMNEQDPGVHRGLSGLIEERIQQALERPTGPDRTARNVVLMPKTLVERFADHQLTSTSTAGRLGNRWTSAFRGTVLPFSTKWMTGNVFEAALRSAMVGVIPGRDHLIGRRLIKALEELDPEAGRAARVRLTGGQLYGSAARLDVHREGASADVPGLRHVGRAMGTAARAPGVRTAIQGITELQRLIFATNKGLERAFQYGVIGKRTRMEIQELNNSWIKSVRAHKGAIEDAAKGLQGTPKQVQFARYLDETLGKYGRFSPTTRMATQNIAPFLPWYLNALRFVTHTLPVRHPVKLAVIANVEATLDREFDEQRDAVPPGDLGAAIKVSDGAYLNLARYTPFGAFTNMPAAITDPWLPQVSGAYENLQGRAWTGQPLRGPEGEVPREDRIPTALYGALESTVPGIALGRRLQEHGETAFDTSKVWDIQTKPDTSHGSSAFTRVFDPFRPVYLKPGQKGDSAGQELTPVQKALRDAQQSTTPQVGGKGLTPVQKALRDAQRARGGP